MFFVLKDADLFNLGVVEDLDGQGTLADDWIVKGRHLILRILQTVDIVDQVGLLLSRCCLFEIHVCSSIGVEQLVFVTVWILALRSVHSRHGGRVGGQKLAKVHSEILLLLRGVENVFHAPHP